MAVGYDTAATAFAHGSTASPSLTVASNSDRVLVGVFSYNNTGANKITSISYSAGSGGTWTRLNGYSNAGPDMSLEIWYSVAPSTGSVTIAPSVTGITSDFFATVISFYDADQTTVMNGFTSANSHTLTITTTAGDYAVAGIIAALSPAPIVTGTEIGSNGYDRLERSGRSAASGSSTTIAWTDATAYDYIAGANVIQVSAGAAGQPTMRRFGGVPGMGQGQTFGRSW